VTATAVETIFAGAPKVPTIEIAPNPKNPRGKIERADIEELAASVRADGILVPLILRKGDKGYVVVAGHRRLAAAKLVGLSEVPAVIVPQDKGRDLELALVENEQRQDLDPLATAAAVADLLERKGATVDGVAATLGKSRRWVALRASLSKLSPKVLKARTSGELREWPAEWLLELGVLTAADQDALLASRWVLEDVTSRSDVVRLVEQRLCRLKEAPWDLDDAQLVPKQGKCTTCTRHSAAAPGLFEEPAAAKLETALCRDSGCFAEKRNAWRGALVRAKRDELGDKLVLAHSKENAGYTHDESERLKKAVGQPIVSSYDLQRAKKGEAGAVPVLTVDGPDEGTVRWMKKGKAAAISGRARASFPSKPSSLKELREALDKRRRTAAVREARAWLEKTTVSAIRSDEHLVGLVAAFGVDKIDAGESPEDGQSEAWPALHLAAIPRRAAVWAKVRERILHKHLRDWMLNGEHAAPILADLETELGIPWKRLLAEQTAKIPEPKSWSDRKPAPAKKPTKPTTAKGKPRAAARTSKARS